MAANQNNNNPNNMNLNNLSLRSILEKEKLNHTNFVDWFRNLRIVLKHEDKAYVLDDPIPDQPDEADAEAMMWWEKYCTDARQVACLMLGTMVPDLQKDFENHSAYDMITQLKEMFMQLSRVERFETVRALWACRMDESQSVSSYVLKMKSYIDRLTRLNCPVSNELATDLILNSLSKRFEPFVLNYNMNGMDKSIAELHVMLRRAEASMGKKALPVLTINEGGSRNTNASKLKVAKRQGPPYQGKGKGKMQAPSKPPNKKQKVGEKANNQKDDPCFHCGEMGHWKRNCPVFLKELKAKRDVGQTSGMTYMIYVELSITSSKTWVLDTGCGTHICNSLQGFKRSDQDAGAISLFMGNRAKVHVEAQWDYVLKLPNGLELILNNVLYAPLLTRNIISVSRLKPYGYGFKFVNDDIHVS